MGKRLGAHGTTTTVTVAAADYAAAPDLKWRVLLANGDYWMVTDIRAGHGTMMDLVVQPMREYDVDEDYHWSRDWGAAVELRAAGR